MLKSRTNDYLQVLNTLEGTSWYTTKRMEIQSSAEWTFRKRSYWTVTGERCQKETDCKITLKSSSQQELTYQTFQQVGKGVELWDESKSFVLRRKNRKNSWRFGKKKVDSPGVVGSSKVIIFYDDEDDVLSSRTDSELRIENKQAIKWTLIRIENKCKMTQEEI